MDESIPRSIQAGRFFSKKTLRSIGNGWTTGVEDHSVSFIFQGGRPPCTCRLSAQRISTNSTLIGVSSTSPRCDSRQRRLVHSLHAEINHYRKELCIDSAQITSSSHGGKVSQGGPCEGGSFVADMSRLPPSMFEAVRTGTGCRIHEIQTSSGTWRPNKHISSAARAQRVSHVSVAVTPRPPIRSVRPPARAAWVSRPTRIMNESWRFLLRNNVNELWKIVPRTSC